MIQFKPNSCNSQPQQMLNSGLGELLLPKGGGFYRSEYEMKDGPTKGARFGFALDPPRFLILKEVVNQGETRSQTKQPIRMGPAVEKKEDRAQTHEVPIGGACSVVGNPKAPERASDKMRDLRHPYLMVTEHLEKKVNLRVETVICEFLPGQSAETLLRNSEFFNLKTCRWEALRQRMLQMLGVACAVRSMHKVGVVHHDICPQNMVLCNDDMLHLLTFGCGATDEKDRNAYPTVMHNTYRNPKKNLKEEFGTEDDVFAFARTYFAWLTNCPAGDITGDIETKWKELCKEGDEPMTQEELEKKRNALEEFKREKTLELTTSMYDTYENGVEENAQLAPTQKKFAHDVGEIWMGVIQKVLEKGEAEKPVENIDRLIQEWNKAAEELDTGDRDCFRQKIDAAERKGGKESEMGTVAKINEILDKYPITDHGKLAEILNLEEIYYFYWFSLKDVVRAVEDETAKKEVCKCFSRLLGAYRESRSEQFLKEKIQVEIDELTSIVDGKK